MLYECFGSLKQKKNQQDIGNTLLKKNLAIWAECVTVAI